MAQVQNGSPKEKEINWDLVDRLLEAGCPGTEIAPRFAIHPETLYDRAYKEFGIMWTEYAQKKRQKGNGNIRVKQYQKALDGDNMMLIWLGKNRLDQTDSPKQDLSINETTIDQTLELAKLKAENTKLKEIINESQAGIVNLRGEQTP